MLGAGKEEHAGLLVLGQIVAERMGVYQGAASLPVLRCGLGMHDQWIGLRASQDAIGLTGQRIGQHAISKGELVGWVDMILVLTGMATRLREAIVQDDPPTASDMRRDAGEHTAPLRILIESTIDEFPQKATALRTSPAIGHVDADPPLSERVCRALGIGVGMQQERDEIAHA